MSLFAVLFPAENPELIAVIKEKFPDNYKQITPTQWIISAKSTAQQVSDKLGITGKGKSVGNAVILAIAGYWGRANADVWEWMKVKVEEGTNG